MPILWNVREASVAARSDRRTRDVAVVEEDGSRLHPPQTGDGLDQLRLSVALDARESKNLSPGEREAHAVDGGRAIRARNDEIAHLEGVGCRRRAHRAFAH